MSKRRKRKTSTTPKSTPPPAPPLPQENNRKEGWWGKLKLSRTFYEALGAAFIVGLALVPITVLYDRWTETLGENTKLEARAKIAESANSRLHTDVDSLRKKNEELASLHPILQFYGTNAELIVSFDLKKEVGTRASIGNCPRSPCLIFTMWGIVDNVATLGLSGKWASTTYDFGEKGDALSFALPLKKGCRSNIRADKYDINFVIEEDRYLSLKAGIGISIASSFVNGIELRESGCP